MVHMTEVHNRESPQRLWIPPVHVEIPAGEGHKLKNRQSQFKQPLTRLTKHCN
jgi:hypothetical protein